MLKAASWLKLLLLVRVTEYEELVPCCTTTDAGLALTAKPDDATTVKVAEETTDEPPVVTVTDPDVAPAGMTKESVVSLALTIGAATVPPPCWLSVTCGLPGEVKEVPVSVMTVPTGADLGLKSVIELELACVLNVVISWLSTFDEFPLQVDACTPVELTFWLSDRAESPDELLFDSWILVYPLPAVSVLFVGLS
jgi:hypothetical protein